jgi:hypothetical protein
LAASHFDRLIRALATVPSRRELSRALGGLLLATPLSVGRNAAGVAGKKKNRKQKNKCKGARKKVSVCHSGQTLRVRTSALVAHLEHGDTFGACPAPPSSFCVGKNECVSSPARCELSGPECFCWVTIGNEQPFCGQEADIRDDCSLCVGDEVCVDASGPECGAVSACSVPCPNPQ